MKQSRVVIVVFAALAGLAGCGVDLHLAGETVACGSAAQCPAPLECAVNAGRCVDPSLAEDEAPQLVNAASTDIATVRLTFSEPVDRAAGDPESYVLRPTLTVESVEQSVDLREATLRIAGLIPGFEYAVTASGIADLYGNALGAPNSATFLGFGAFPDRNPPTIIAPALNASTTGSVRLVWARAALAYSYTVDVSYDESFTAPLAASVTVLDPQSSIDFDIMASGPHFWRVRANTTVPDVYSHGSFIGLGDTVYVYCPASALECSDAGKFGTSTSPLQTLSGGVNLARSIGAREVRVAARGGDAVYSDSVQVSGELRIVGGYAPDFAEATRNPRAYITTVSTQRDRQRAVFTMLDSSGTTTVEGLRVLGWGDYAFVVQGIYNGAVHIRDNDLWARGAPGRAIYVNDSRADSVDYVLIENNHLFPIVPDDVDNFELQFVVAEGVLIENAAASVVNNVWEMPERCNRRGGVCTALHVDAGSVRFTGNKVSIPADQEPHLDVAAVLVVNSAFDIRDNVVNVTGVRQALNRALYIDNLVAKAPAVVANNIFMSDGADDRSYGSSYIRAVSPTRLVNNLFATGASATDPYALRFDNPANATIANNVFIGPPSSQYCLYGEYSFGEVIEPAVAGNIGVVCNSVFYPGIYPGGTDTTSVMFSSIADLHFVSYPDDLHWSTDTPAAARNAGPYAGAPP